MIRKTQIAGSSFCWGINHLRSVGFAIMSHTTRSSEWTSLNIWSEHFRENGWFPLTSKSGCWKSNFHLSDIWSSL